MSTGTINLSFDPSLIPWIIITLFVIAIIESVRLFRSDGNPRRGFIIWKRPLFGNERDYLTKLKEDVVVYQPVQFSRSPAKQGFIHIEGNKALIYFRTPKWRTIWPYVGFVDLSSARPYLEYRGSFFMHLLISPFVFVGIVSKAWVMLLMVGGLMYFNFSVETKAIDNFLAREIENSSTYKKGKSQK